jgi:hypothetical protein
VLPQFVVAESGLVAAQLAVLGFVFVLIAPVSDSAWVFAVPSDRWIGARSCLSSGEQTKPSIRARCTMRKLIFSNIMSLDGYFEGPEKNVMLLPMDGFFDQHNLERLHAADTLLLGATTYAGLKGTGRWLPSTQ